MKFIRLLLISILVLPATTFAEDLTFEDWDTDNDGVIEKEEFTSKFIDEFYSSWDPTDEKGLLEESFFKTSYAGLDTDNDGYLKDEEWIVGYNYFYEDYVDFEYVDFADLDGNKIITYDEYFAVLHESDYFTDIDLDADNYISEYELAEFVFENWDFNSSGTLSEFEYDRFDWYYLDV